MTTWFTDDNLALAKAEFNALKDHKGKIEITAFIGHFYSLLDRIEQLHKESATDLNVDKAGFAEFYMDLKVAEAGLIDIFSTYLGVLRLAVDVKTLKTNQYQLDRSYKSILFNDLIKSRRNVKASMRLLPAHGIRPSLAMIDLLRLLIYLVNIINDEEQVKCISYLSTIIKALKQFVTLDTMNAKIDAKIIHMSRELEAIKQQENKAAAAERRAEAAIESEESAEQELDPQADDDNDTVYHSCKESEPDSENREENVIADDYKVEYFSPTLTALMDLKELPKLDLSLNSIKNLTQSIWQSYAQSRTLVLDIVNDCEPTLIGIKYRDKSSLTLSKLRALTDDQLLEIIDKPEDLATSYNYERTHFQKAYCGQQYRFFKDAAVKRSATARCEYKFLLLAQVRLELAAKQHGDDTTDFKEAAIDILHDMRRICAESGKSSGVTALVELFDQHRKRLDTNADSRIDKHSVFSSSMGAACSKLLQKIQHSTKTIRNGVNSRL